jgi:hypothetical protein
MASRATTTLIAVSSDRIGRVDLDGASKPAVFSWQTARLPGQLPEEAVAAALQAERRCARSVWVLCEDFWTQELSLSAAAVAGLDAQQLERVLGFELESLSGLGATESEIGFVPVQQKAGMAVYWITQVARADRLRIDQAVRAGGGRLMGLLHPGGLPQALQHSEASPANREWFRIEIWGDLTICLAGQSNGLIGTHVINGSPLQESWGPTVSEWLGRFETPRAVWMAGADEPRVEVLCSGASLPERAFAGISELASPTVLEGESLDRWMVSWARALSQGGPQVPIIKPEALPTPTRRYVGVSVVLAVAALIGCMVHAGWMNRRIVDARIEMRRAEEPRRQAAALLARLSVLKAELQRLQEARPATASSDPATELMRQKSRVRVLLSALSRLVQDNHVVTGLQTEARGGLVIVGLSLTPEAADTLALALGRLCRPSGWAVSGAQKTALLQQPNGGPWEFRVNASPPAGTGQAAWRGGAVDDGARIERYGGTR